MSARSIDGLSIGSVTVDLRGGCLRDPHGDAIYLRAQAFAVLHHLLSNERMLVAKEDLLSAVWPGVSVTDDSIVQCVHEIRRALGDTDHTILRTVARRGYCLTLGGSKSASDRRFPTIAVVSFSVLDGGREMTSYADGLREELITCLVRIPGVIVVAEIAATSPNTDPHRLSDGPGARYLVTGSIRSLGSDLRITAKLIDSETSVHLWAENFEGVGSTQIDQQRRLAEQIAGAVEPSVRRAEIERARRRAAVSATPYDLYLKAIPHAFANTLSQTEKALEHLDAALTLDPDFLPAHGYAAWCREQKFLRGGFRPSDREAALRHAGMALGPDNGDPQTLSLGAFVRANLTRDYASAFPVMDRALILNPNSAFVLGFSALVSAHGEQHDRAISHARRALALSPPNDPLNYHPYCALAVSYLFAGAYSEAAEFAQLTVLANPGFSVPHAYLIAAQMRLGQFELARASCLRLLEADPGFSLVAFASMDLFRQPLMAGLVEALAAAGMR